MILIGMIVVGWIIFDCFRRLAAGNGDNDQFRD